MFFIHDLLRPFQAYFSDTELGRERSALFASTLLEVIVPFTSSMKSNLFYGSGCHHINHWDAIKTRSDLERDHLPDRDWSAAR